MTNHNSPLTVIGVIPARYGSTRLPGKPLIKINGKPIIQHVYESAMKSKKLNRLIVATDDKRIYNAVTGFWGEAVMTSSKHKSGTDRVGEAVKNIDCDIVVNIQGDEPFIDYRNIDKAIEPLVKDKELNVATLAAKIDDIREINDSNTVKVFFDKEKYAVDFSRTVKPFNNKSKRANFYKHIGLYVFRKNFLLKFIKMKSSKREEKEKLEQLRILDNGEDIKVVITRLSSQSVDTKEDLKKILKNG
ncbi:MAG: 3-deoxy-manno-octulosonate cytidylyltransferase [Chlorobi bacterium]|nr:3-deoxy-manno-octulosonate cytidylyltransferase [Chlorobiota bacterium]MCI0715228.1 3-deoxy-manno-octulosonate cytidylyltransferase [Chlorobiota bacterium]